MEKVKLSIGLFDRNTKKQEVDTFEATQLIERAILATGAAGLSIYHGNGVYLHDDGSLVKEPSIFVEVYGWKKEGTKKAVAFLKKELNQESIAVESSRVDIDFM